MKIKELASKHTNLRIEFSKTSIKYLEKQTLQTRGWIISKIDFAIDNPNTMIRLKGKPIKHKIRVGDIRIVLILIKIPKGIQILEIGNRGKIYKRLVNN